MGDTQEISFHSVTLPGQGDLVCSVVPFRRPRISKPNKQRDSSKKERPHIPIETEKLEKPEAVEQMEGS